MTIDIDAAAAALLCAAFVTYCLAMLTEERT